MQRGPAPAGGRKMAARKIKAIYQVKVTLKDIRPPIWRRLLVSNAMPLADFHRALQCAMGWLDLHLHQFTVDRQSYGIPETDWPDETLHERRFTVGDLLTAEQDSLLYEYDFGDGWQHKVVLEKILPFDRGVALPQCLKGRRACPPEDIGGPAGYRELLAATDDPERAEPVEGSPGDRFEPEAFDAAAVTQALQNRC